MKDTTSFAAFPAAKETTLALKTIITPWVITHIISNEITTLWVVTHIISDEITHVNNVLQSWKLGGVNGIQRIRIRVAWNHPQEVPDWKPPLL